MVLSTVRRALFRRGMVRQGETVLVGVSGGVDSVVLLHCLHRLAPALGIRLHIAHLDHGIRGEAGGADAAFIREMAEGLGLPVTLERLPPGALAQRGRSLQEAARAARYAFFGEAAEKASATRIAVAHTADDVAETVLMNLLRGSGPAGLRGIPPVRNRQVIRPLLTVRRRQVEEYARARRLRFRSDPSNEDPRFLRNRIRHRLVPFLEKEFNPRVVECVARAAALLEEDHAYLDGQAASAASGPPYEVAALTLLPRPVRRRVLLRALRAGLAPGSRVRLEHVLAAEALLEHEGEGGAVRLPGPLEARIRAGRLILGPPGDPGLTPAPLPVGLPLGGEARWGAFRATATLGRQEKDARAQGAAGGHGCWCVTLDADRLQPPLTLRAWQSGDAYRPAGSPGRRKLQDLFTDAKVPRGRRRCLPVLTDAAGVLWVAGFRPAGRVAATAATTRPLTVRVLEEPPDAL